MEFDIERFIMEIEIRPAIWDMRSSEYSDRFQKIKQWEELINIFSEEGTSDKDKKEKGRVLQAKWKNLRDAFIKESRKQAVLVKNGTAASRTPQYRFYNQLLFLKPFAAKIDNGSNISVEIDNETAGRPHKDSLRPKKKKIKTIDCSEKIGRELVDTLKYSLNQVQKDNEDTDRLFMLSLVAELKKVPDHLKSHVKINLIKCLMEAQDETYSLNQAAYPEHYSNYEQTHFGSTFSGSSNMCRENVETILGAVTPNEITGENNSINSINKPLESDIKTEL